MKKLLVMVAMVAMMLAAAAPAFAQDVTVTTGDNTEYNAVGQNLIGTVGDISATQTGVAKAGNGSTLNDSAAVATVDQGQDVSLVQSNVVLNDFNGNGFVDFFDFFWWWF